MPSNQQDRFTNGEIIVRCLDGADILRARQKEINKEHNERIKGLLKLQAQIRHQAKSKQAELEGLSSITLTPELERLLENPLSGL